MTVTWSPKCSFKCRVRVVLPEPVPPAMPMRMVFIGSLLQILQKCHKTELFLHYYKSAEGQKQGKGDDKVRISGKFDAPDLTEQRKADIM